MRHIGVDVGGTFTDVFLVGERGFSIHKVPTSPHDPSLATVEGMREACARQGLELADLDLVFHGTTIATNTVLQRSGATVGLITTRGFRDILHIARHKKPFNFSLYQELPWQKRPLVPRRLRLTARERVTAPEGEVLTPLVEGDVEEAVDELERAGVEAVAVCFLHSYLNPEHEVRVGEIVAARLPEAFVSLRHVVCPEYREYEAFNTTALNAYLGPITGRYLGQLGSRLAGAGREGDVLFMTSTGGVESGAAVASKPVQMVLSGPVAGVVGGLAAGRASGLENLITLDVGGTSADIGLVHEGGLRHKHWLDNQIGGLQLRLSMIDVSTIGAGGGSIAYADAGGLLQVGPRSAGADPGPACYGRGGQEPTVTDAQLVLGRLHEDAFLGGRMTVSRELAERALRERVAEPLAITLEEAAAGILRVATAHLVEAIELASVRRGFDPREFTLVAFGGAGALFGADIARELSIPQLLVPRFPGVAAAIGLLASDVVHSYSQSVVGNLSRFADDELEMRYRALEERAREQLDRDGFAAAERLVERYAECRYAGQGYEIRITVPPGPVTSTWKQTVTSTFHEAHEREYGNAFLDRELVVVNVGVRGIGVLPQLPIVTLAQAKGPADPDGERRVWFEAAGAALRSSVYARDHLLAGHTVSGPAIIEQEDSTTAVPPGLTANVDASGNLLLSFDAEIGPAA